MTMKQLNRFDDLMDIFGWPKRLELVNGNQMPEPYKSLLVHQRHMTVTLEKYWQTLTELHVVDLWEHHPYYTRRIYLTTRDSQRPVEYGLVQLDFNACSEQIQQAIRARQIPLGRILKQNDVPTEINCRSYFKIIPSQANIEAFDLNSDGPMYGRYADVEFDGKHAMILIEVMPAGLEVKA
jgi:chorismate-pyruvate lyase